MIRLSAFADEASKVFDEQIAALKRNGIEMIELRGLDGINIRKITEESAADYARRLQEAGITVWSIGSPIGKIKINDDFEEEERGLRHICRLAKIFGTDRIRIFSFYEAYEEEEKVFSYLNRFLEIAGEEGCKLYHENEKLIFGDTAERVLWLMKKVPGLHWIYDPANFIEVGDEPELTLPALCPKVDYFHIKDALWDTKEIVPAGLGDGKIPEMIRMLPAEGDFTLTLEPHLSLFEGYSDIDPTEMKNKYTFATEEEAFDAAVAALKKVLAEAGYQETKGGFVKK